MVIVVQWLQNCSSPYKSAPLPSQFKILSRQALKQVGQDDIIWFIWIWIWILSYFLVIFQGKNTALLKYDLRMIRCLYFRYLEKNFFLEILVPQSFDALSVLYFLGIEHFRNHLTLKLHLFLS